MIWRPLFKKYLYSRAWLSLPEPELKNWTSLSYFSKPEPKKTLISKYCQNPNFKKTRKLKLDQIQFWTIKNFAKKRCILTTFWSKFSLIHVNSKTRPVLSQFSQTQKTRIRKILKFWNPINSNLNPKEASKLNPKKSKLDQALLFRFY